MGEILHGFDDGSYPLDPVQRLVQRLGDFLTQVLDIRFFGCFMHLRQQTRCEVAGSGYLAQILVFCKQTLQALKTIQ